ncbi:two-component sensor histidine kinase [Paenibacillus sp. BIHB 4019]|uniref:histidine kinase n=1 Tax=Paenibacillus sp. BIHB 4019 TaxID=1870819 RepID=A0A1B2DBR2_9BACL|nr:HAMP domain-containing sensor histidine kinase [Paenibacillus sp. BIHB 4019]ANY65153.1 two-component sensor histidine kinase [Paenibacillus sp. BIHB 4019]
MTIRLRLTLWYSALLAMTLLIFGFAIYIFVNYNTYGQMKDQLKGEADSYNVFVRETESNELNLLIAPSQGRFYERSFYLQIVRYKEGIINASKELLSTGIKYPIPDVKDNVQAGFIKANIKVNDANVTFLIYQRPIYSESKEPDLVGLIQVGAIVTSEESYLKALRTILFTASFIAVLIAFTTGLLLARQVLRPIERVIKSTEKIQNGSDLSVRIPMDGPYDEVGRLVYNLNVMLARLETAYNELDESYKAQRRFVSDASHELRTPLTTIRGNIELLQRMWEKTKDPDAFDGIVLALDNQRFGLTVEAMQDIAAESRRMSTLVNDLLALARADAGYEMEKTVVSMQPLVEEVARRAQLLPRTAEWRVGDLSPLSGIEVRGNQDYLQQLLFIFIENAFKYTVEGHIELSVRSKDNQVGITVSDTGMGMDPEEVPHIFDRFYRVDESRGKTVGTGLGLSIAKWIIDEHRGSIEVLTRTGEGSEFTIWLPVVFSETADSSIIEGTDRTLG